MKCTATELSEKKKDATSFINDVLNKIPEEKKIEALRLVEGFAVCASSGDEKKAG